MQMIASMAISLCVWCSKHLTAGKWIVHVYSEITDMRWDVRSIHAYWLAACLVMTDNTGTFTSKRTARTHSYVPLPLCICNFKLVKQNTIPWARFRMVPPCLRCVPIYVCCLTMHVYVWVTLRCWQCMFMCVRYMCMHVCMYSYFKNAQWIAALSPEHTYKLLRLQKDI